ncbi:translation initiation factor IF-2-like [Penaeus monodon]|uniref:translation initiation factor IF-2-like n=1 Tax=Penaeus monodon TaxID=6687 RepID=UPI0018A716C4|nr:translation initiation factor IF-2-like [Penaeus monodon]
MSAPRPRPPAPGPPRTTTTPTAAAAAAAPAAAATCTKGQTLGRPCTGSSRSTVPVQGAWRRQPGSAAPGPPIPAVSRPGPLAARPPLPRRRSGAQGFGRAVPSPAPCPRPPVAAQHTAGPGSGGPPPPGPRARPPGVIRFRCIRHGLACVPCCLTLPPPRTRRSHHRNHAHSPPITPSLTPLTSLRPSHSQPARGSPRGTRRPSAQLLTLSPSPPAKPSSFSSVFTFPLSSLPFFASSRECTLRYR